MKPLDARTRQHIIDLLTPLMATDGERRALLILTLFDHPLLNQLEYTGPTQIFVLGLIDKLFQFGKLDDERPVLWALLETVREQVGLDQKHLIDALRPAFELPPPPRRDRIFISYSRKNERDAQRIVSNLKDAGLRVWYDREKIKGGTEWWASIERGILNADYFVFCLSTASIRSQVARDELLTARRNNKPIFAIMLEDCLSELYDKDFAEREGFAEISWLPSLHIINFTQPDTYGNSLRELIQSLPGYALPDGYYLEQIDPSELPNPFRGLEAFLEVDAPYFAGREDAVQEILAHLQDVTKPRLLAVVGASGSGKSSLVQAGVIPALRRVLPFWETLIIKPGESPLNELADRLHERRGAEADSTRERLSNRVSALDDITAELMQGKPNEARFVLVIDQFEELFTLTSDDERQQVLDVLLYAVKRAGGRVQVLLTMRADFFDRLSAVPELARLVRENLDIATDMTPDQLRRSIETPARQVGVTYEEGLVEQILEDVRAQPGSLPLLQYALKELFERKVGRRMTRDAYNSLGGVRGALATRAEAIYTALDPAQQDALRRVLLRLVDVGDETLTRRRVAQIDLSLTGIPDDIVQNVLNRLTASEARLLVVSAPLDDDDTTNDGQIFYEVSHEALLTHWARLETWIAENRGDLRLSSDILALAKAWEGAGRLDASYLLTGGRLIAAQEWLERGDATPLQRAFVEASIVYRQAEIERLENLTHQAEDATQKSEIASKRAVRNRTIAVAVSLSAIIITIIAALLTSTNISSAQQQVIYIAGTASVGETEIAALTPTLYAVLTQVQSAQNFSDSIQLAARAQDITKNGDQPLGLALALEASHIDSSLQTERILSDIAYQPGQVKHKELPSVLSDDGIIFSPDGSFAIFISDEDNKENLNLWDIKTDSIHSFEQFDGSIGNVDISPDGKKLILASGNTLILWDIPTGHILRYFDEYSKQIFRVIFSPDEKNVISSSENVFTVWDITTGRMLREIDNSALGSGIVLSPDGKTAISWKLNSYPTSLVLWNFATGAIVRRFEYNGTIREIEFSPDGKTLISAPYQDGLILWDVMTGDILLRFAFYPGLSRGIAFSPDGKTLISGTDHNVILWDVRTGNPIQVFEGHKDLVENVAFSANGKFIISASSYGKVIIWGTESGSIVRYLKKPFEGSLLNAVFSPDGQSIVTSVDNEVLLLDTETGSVLRRFKIVLSSDGINDLAFSPDGLSIAAAVGQGVHLWDVTTGDLIRSFGSLSDVSVSYNVSFSPDGKSILVGYSRGQLILWDVLTGHLIREFQESGWGTLGIAFSPDGQLVISAEKGSIGLWEVSTGRLIHKFEDTYDAPSGIQEIWSIAFSSDGKTFISGHKVFGTSRYGKLLLWDVATGKLLRRFEGHTDVITSVKFSPDGQSILSGSSDNTLIVWDTATGTILRRYEAPKEGLTYNSIDLVAFGPDGQSLLSVSAYGSLVLWRNDSLEQLQAWILENRYIPQITCEQRIAYSTRLKCIEGTPPVTPTFQPTQTPFPVPQWTPIASPTLSPALGHSTQTQ